MEISIQQYHPFRLLPLPPNNQRLHPTTPPRSHPKHTNPLIPINLAQVPPPTRHLITHPATLFPLSLDLDPVNPPSQLLLRLYRPVPPFEQIADLAKLGVWMGVLGEGLVDACAIVLLCYFLCDAEG